MNLPKLQAPNRKNQLWTLILLSALTMAIPYAIQGTLAMSSCPAGLDWWICAGDKYAWAIRAIVEGIVIGYIARTKAQDKVQTAILWIFKALLLILIAGTLGPSLYATAQGQTVTNSLHPIALWVWTFGLAAYMPLMVAGAAYAYKCQPDDTPQIDVISLQENLAWQEQRILDLQSEIDELQKLNTDGNRDAKQTMQVLGQTQAELIAAQKRLETVEAELLQVNQAVQTWNLLPIAKRIKLIKYLCNGDTPSTADLARAEGVAYSTVSRALGGKDK